MFEHFSGSKTARLPLTTGALVAPGRSLRRGHLLAGLVIGALALVSSSAASTVASVQLSQGLPFSDIDFGSTRPQISPNGQWAVYRQDAVLNGVNELWSVRVDGTGQPIRLTDPLWDPVQVVTFAISPNSARVVYKVAMNTACETGGVPDCRIELFSIPIDGSAPPEQLNPTLGVNRNVTSFLISPLSTRVFYISDQVTDNVYQLYSVSITGGTAVRLNADLPSDWDVEAYRVSPNGQTVVYRDERAALGYGRLWSVPANGTSAAVNINLPLPNFGAVGSYFQISPNSNKVVYRADAISDDSFNLYTVPIGGGSSTALNIGLAGSSSVESGFLIADDNSRVVYLAAPLSQTPTFQLYSAPLGGGTPETRLNGTMGAGEDVEAGFALDFDGAKVVYRSDEGTNDMIELYAVPIAGGTRTKLNGALTAGGDVYDFAISPDDSRVVYIADQSVDELKELWSVAIVGGAVTKLNRTLAVSGDVQAFRISPNSSWVIYGADQDADSVDELLGAPIDGGTVVDVSGQLINGGDVTLTFAGATIFQISSNSVDVVYAADEESDDQIELFKSGVGGPPGPPLDVVAVPGNTLATVNFTAPLSDGGSPIDDYAVTVISTPPTPGAVVQDSGCPTCPTRLVINLVNGRAYTFAVRAHNAYDFGALSESSNSVTPATVPAAPGQPTAIARNGSADVSFAASSSDGGSPITGYTVTAHSTDPLAAPGIDTSAGKLFLVHYVSRLTNGSPYTFTVVAHNAVGSSAPSAASAAPVIPVCLTPLPPDALSPEDADVFCSQFELGIAGDTTGWGPPPALNVVKTVTSSGPYGVGSSIDYSLVVTNTGFFALTGVTVTDPGAVVGICTPAQPATVAAAGTLTCAATHVVTQNDMNAGSYLNTATADSDQTGPDTADANVTFIQTPALSIDKTAVQVNYTLPGDIINYNFLVTNSGNVTLAGLFSVTDDKTTDEACPPTPILAPGASITCTATYIITPGDITAGQVTNIAAATNGDETVTSPTDSVTIPYLGLVSEVTGPAAATKR